jgi:hypothetical protein
MKMGGPKAPTTVHGLLGITYHSNEKANVTADCIENSSYIEWTEIPFVNHVKYLGVIFDKRITWRLPIEVIKAKAFRTFIRIYSLFESERLSVNIKLTDQVSNCLCLPRVGISSRYIPFKIAALSC